MPSHPTIFWAQRKDVVYLRFAVSAATDVALTLTEDAVDFRCKSEGTDYACKLNLYAAIDVDASKYKVMGPSIEAILKKREVSETFWSALVQGPKLPYVRIDWDRWIDEGEDEDGAAKLPDMGGFGGMPGMGDMDFSKMMGQNFDPADFKMPEGEDDEDDGDDAEDDEKQVD